MFDLLAMPNKKIYLGVSDKRLTLLDCPSIADYLELHLNSLKQSDVERLLKSGWSGRTPIGSGIISPNSLPLLLTSSIGEIVKNIQYNIVLAAKLGIKELILAGGRVRSIPDNMTLPQAKENFYALLRDLLPILNQTEIRILIEPLNQTETNFLHTLHEAYEIIQKFPVDRVGLVYDLYHSRLSKESWCKQSIAAIQRVTVVHIAGAHKSMPNLHKDNWLINELKYIISSCYSGYLSVEVEPVHLYNLYELKECIYNLYKIIGG